MPLPCESVDSPGRNTSVVRAFRGGGGEGTGGRKASWKGGEESSSLHSGVVAAAERCSVGFHRGAAGCLAATTELYLSAV